MSINNYFNVTIYVTCHS